MIARSVSAAWLTLFLLIGCNASGSGNSGSNSNPDSFTVEIVNTYKHDRAAFTQGLLIENGQLFESTGRNGQSTVRKVELETGNVTQSTSLPTRYFGEGLAALNDRLYMLTWTSGEGFIFDAETLRRTGTFEYEGEGWGLTTDGTDLIMSNGTDEISFLDARTFKSKRKLKVRRAGQSVQDINELEWIDGLIWANVWQSSDILQIDPKSGAVVGIVDARLLVDTVNVAQPRDNVLNGIAWDRSSDRIFLTGKKWPSLFEVRLIPNPAQ